MTYLILFMSAVFGYWVSHMFSRPNTRVRRRLPTISLKIIDLSPNVRIRIGRRVIHMHHWLNLSILLVITLTFGITLLDNLFSVGFMLGGIIQGLTFPDWRKFIIKKD